MGRWSEGVAFWIEGPQRRSNLPQTLLPKWTLEIVPPTMGHTPANLSGPRTKYGDIQCYMNSNKCIVLKKSF